MTELRLPNLNITILSGRLVQDPELRYTTQGRAITKFRVAVSRRYKDSQGEWKDDTLFIGVTTWGDLAERCQERLKKGSPVIIQGRLTSSEWETSEGQKRSKIEVNAMSVQFLEKAQQQNEPGNADIPDEKEPEEELPGDVNF